jgi:hypothetical protein
MSAPAFAGRPALTIRGARYPVLLPSVRDPRLHLAAVIVSLQVLGQTAFEFNLSIAQILISLGTCAILEVGIAFFRQHILMWPASALLTGNGVAFILRVPGTEHGDWWSLRGWWIYAGTAAISLLSKHLIRFRGGHIFNPSNFGLVVCFLALGRSRAEPLDFWWGPMSVWLALALGIIVAGGLAILSRLRLLAIAVGFWVAFAAGIGILAVSGHSMTARWHLGPISGAGFWWLLVTSPEILVFLFFMITDPRTIPSGRVARLTYAVGVGLLATLLIAPQKTEYATKVAVLSALFLVCAARPLLERILPAAGAAEDDIASWARSLARRGRLSAGALTVGAAVAFGGLVVVAGIPARPGAAEAGALPADAKLPRVTVVAKEHVSAKVDGATAERIARDVVLDLSAESDALRLRDPERAAVGAGGDWLIGLRRRIGGAAGGPITASTYRVDSVQLTLRPGKGQSPPRIFAVVEGAEESSVYRGEPPELVVRHASTPFRRSLELALQQGHFVIVGGESTAPVVAPPAAPESVVRASGPLADVRLRNVASQVGLDFRQGAYRFGVSNDLPAMMGGGLCWLDYDNDGWLDLFVVNSYSDADRSRWETRGRLPESALFHNVQGAFVNVSRKAHANLAVRGEGCVAADFNSDGFTDLYVTTADGDKLLWNNGDGTFTEGARAAGITSTGWHSGAAVADVNGDGRSDLFVAGYTDPNTPVPGSIAGFPSNFMGVRDLLYLNEGPGAGGRSHFREVGVEAGLEAARFSHGLGALFTDYNGDGRPDLYVANDEDPNELYENVAWPGGAAADPEGLGFRFEERGHAEGVDDPYAGMGIASGDYDGDGRLDLFVTNSRREPHAVLRRSTAQGGPAFRDGRPAFAAADANSTGWGASWVDLASDSRPDLVLANGSVPITSLAKDAGQIQVLANAAPGRRAARFANIRVGGLAATARVDGRGLAAADYDNNGTIDVAVGSIGGRLILLRNSGAGGHWLEVALARFAPGAVATLVLPNGRKLVSELHAGSSYLSSEDPRLHFGLGSAGRARSLTVRFPGGGETRLRNVTADRVVLVRPPAAPARAVDAPSSTSIRSDCTRSTGGRSVARVWDDAALAVLRDESPATQARNLFHLSAALWDAWAAYSPRADGYFVTEKSSASDVFAARETAMSYAAYRLLLWRASYGSNMHDTFERLTRTMRALCYEPRFSSSDGDSPAALGNRIAAAAIAYGRSDGSLEVQHYLDATYAPVNEPLVVGQPGTTMHDRTFWQPLAFGQIVVQGGLSIPAKVQTFDDPQWGHVRGFALPASKKGLPLDPGAPPFGDPASAAYKQAALQVIRVTARRERAVLGARSTGDQAPARWNRVAAAVADATERGASPARRLEQDVKLSFALNGALHDAAVAVWGAKRAYQSVRPISMIRSLAFEGQSSDPKAPSYSADGLPLVPGLVELITRASSAAGQHHHALARHVGDVAVRTSRGWVLGSRWSPRSVTPPDPSWVSAESAFARAAAVILTNETGSRRFGRIADTAALAGVYAGTETAADDRAGRKLGAKVGEAAWKLAQRYFAGRR